MENAEKESESVKSNEIKELNNINVSDYLEFYAGEESKLVLVARPTCHYCQIAEPILQNIAYKYDLEINYLNTDENNVFFNQISFNGLPFLNIISHI